MCLTGAIASRARNIRKSFLIRTGGGGLKENTSKFGNGAVTNCNDGRDDLGEENRWFATLTARLRSQNFLSESLKHLDKVYPSGNSLSQQQANQLQQQQQQQQDQKPKDLVGLELKK